LVGPVKSNDLMNGAAFFLTVNFIVALSFSAVFLVVAPRSRSRIAAIWIGAGFGVASLSALCELMVAYTDLAKPWAIGAFSAVLTGMTLLTQGVSTLYGRRFDLRIMAVFLGCSLLLCFAIYDLPRGTFIQAFSYQTPFALVILAGAIVVLSARRRTMIDRFLGAVLLVTGLHFFVKAWLAVVVGAGHTAKDYVHTNYALISQSATAVLVVAVGLTLLAALILEIMAHERSESEIDTLSGLANRRGFDRKVQALLAEASDGRHVVMLCDLDHFKRVNDTFGHHVGDLVIQGFGKLLRDQVPRGGVAGRVGGEEFAVFLSNAHTEAAVQFAQTLRSAIMTMPNLPRDLRPTVSVGISSLTTPDGLAEAYRQADVALYSAKNAGRNRVKIAAGDRART
jgi:diguanylate cyclase (GGDEF)-like protein